MSSPTFNPVLEPFTARILVGYLARAFHAPAAEVPPARSPLWPIACRMAEGMARDNYALGAYHYPELSPMRARDPIAMPTLTAVRAPLPDAGVRVSRVLTGRVAE